MPCVLKIICNEASGETGQEDGKYIRDYIPDIVADGRGNVVCTSDKNLAKRFEDAGEALTFWKQQSKRNPRRPDGRPNRPLTAFTVEIESV